MKPQRTTVSLQSFVAGPLLWSSSGEQIRLAKEINRGGEGAIYEVFGNPDLLAKLYLKSISNDRVAKLAAMNVMAQKDRNLLSFCAWPEATLHEVGPNNSVLGTTGFTMRRVPACHKLDDVYNPMARKRILPDRDWRFLIHVARNIAIAVETIHANDVIIGDVNEGGFLVSPDGRVWAIDCDSFQISHGSRIYRCEVGIPDYTPPELQFISGFDSITRTKNHDLFGLGVLLFRLLMMGKHPYMGIYNNGVGESEIQDHIKHNRFAYGPNALKRQMEQPRNALDLCHLGSNISSLFVKTFSDECTKDGRPSASSWSTALSDLLSRLTKCATNPSHVHEVSTKCPWCMVEGQTGVSYFICVITTTGSLIFRYSELDRLLQQIPSASNEAFPESPASPSVGDPLDPKLVLTLAERKLARTLGYIFTVIVSVALISFSLPIGISFFVIGLISTRLIGKSARIQVDSIIKHRQARVDEIKSEVTSLRTIWNSINDNNPQKQRYVIEQKLLAYRALDSQLKTELNALESLKTEAQIRDYLDSFSIREAGIKGIGKKRIENLEHALIYTAAQVEREKLRNVAGFGGQGLLAEMLLMWKADLLSKFKPDNSKPVNQRDVLRIRQQIETKKTQLEHEITTSCSELNVAVRAFLNRREQLRSREHDCRRYLDKAESDLMTAVKAKG